MDWELKLITLFVYICNHYDEFLWVYGERQSNNDEPKFSDIEVIMIYLWGVMRGHQKVKKYIIKNQKFWWDFFFNKDSFFKNNKLNKEINHLQNKDFDFIQNYIVQKYGPNSFKPLSDIGSVIRTLNINHLPKFFCIIN